VAFQTKPELAWAMLEHAWTLRIPGRWVTADTVDGQDPMLCERLEAWASVCHYVLAIAATHPGLDQAPIRRIAADRCCAGDPDVDVTMGPGYRVVEVRARPHP
jgi:hypothetical protein